MNAAKCLDPRCQPLNIYAAKHPKSPLSAVYIWHKKKEKIDRTIIPRGGQECEWVSWV